MAARFPTGRIGNASDYFSKYIDTLQEAAHALDRDALAKAVATLQALFARGGTLYVCGNGGSAAVSNHMTCDILKGVQTDTSHTPRVVSLSTAIELVTAIANDLEYAEVFVYQLRSLARAGDALLTISASGNSENVVRAITWARDNGFPTIAMTGFSGGRTAGIADVNLHIPCENYGIVEDIHQSIMHVLSQYLRMTGMRDEVIGKRHF